MKKIWKNIEEHLVYPQFLAPAQNWLMMHYNCPVSVWLVGLYGQWAENPERYLSILIFTLHNFKRRFTSKMMQYWDNVGLPLWCIGPAAPPSGPVVRHKPFVHVCVHLWCHRDQPANNKTSPLMQSLFSLAVFLQVFTIVKTICAQHVVIAKLLSLTF